MKKRTIAILGANGFLGQVTARFFAEAGWNTIGFIRNTNVTTGCHQNIFWNSESPEKMAHHLEGTDAVVNLAGRSVDCRYNRPNKAEILRSRLDTTQALATAIARCQQPPKAWLNAASATIYEASYEAPQTEAKGTIGSGFSVSVCRAWENAFFESHLPHTRKVALRTSLVLGHGRNSVYPSLAQLTRLGLGGTIGDGRQMVSWIHELDFARALAFLIENESLEGVVNLAAPAPLPNREFMRSLREQLGRTIGVPTPRWLLQVGTFLLRTEPELVLKSRYVFPEKLMNERFLFRFPFIDEAFGDLANTGTEPEPLFRRRACPSALH